MYIYAKKNNCDYYAKFEDIGMKTVGVTDHTQITQLNVSNTKVV